MQRNPDLKKTAAFNQIDWLRGEIAVFVHNEKRLTNAYEFLATQETLTQIGFIIGIVIL